jgi:granule-bound starch synthase
MAAGALNAATAGKITEGPAAAAVGRAIQAGKAPAVTMKGGKPTAPVAGKKYQIIIVSSELAPYSKTGGLGEAAEGLSIALAGLGHRVMVITPRYDQYKEAWDTDFYRSVDMGGKQEPVHFFHAYKQKVDQVFVDHPAFLERVWGLAGTKIYGPEWGKDFADNQARFAFFCKAALIAIKELPLGGFPYGEDCVLLVNDWHSALVPMFMQAQRDADPSLWKNTKSAFLCHNAVFQGRFELEPNLASVFGVPQKYIDSITFNMAVKVGKKNKKTSCVNTMAAGLKYCDRVLTVSPTYAIECATDPEKGVELEGLFKQGQVAGILNGVKEGISAANPAFAMKVGLSSGCFTVDTVDAAKAQLKAAYRASAGLPNVEVPLMVFVGRLDMQKGYDLLLEALVDVLEDTEMQVVIVGSGRQDLVEQTKAMQKKFPTKFYYAGWMGPERYALVAGSDFTLLPSRWEPCGLVQMEAMRMGTLPIIAPTGGLKDTVEDDVTGFWCDSEMTCEAELDAQSTESLVRALKRAAKTPPQKMSEMRKAAMVAASEFSWTNSAMQYEVVFNDLGAVNVLSKSGNSYVTLENDEQIC